MQGSDVTAPPARLARQSYPGCFLLKLRVRMKGIMAAIAIPIFIVLVTVFAYLIPSTMAF